ncbi:hypothetical protein [Actinomyces howellii]|uniref:hypothetical protein n=1 Tax=Actinomyces howellii TaxID=52771 RepID=UPI000F830546|nr:hypothetical protein [Actinomyces howellii]
MTTSDDTTNLQLGGADGKPLTRRQMRERERAQEAARAAHAASAAPAGTPRVAQARNDVGVGAVPPVPVAPSHEVAPRVPPFHDLAERPGVSGSAEPPHAPAAPERAAPVGGALPARTRSPRLGPPEGEGAPQAPLEEEPPVLTPVPAPSALRRAAARGVVREERPPEPATETTHVSTPEDPEEASQEEPGTSTGAQRAIGATLGRPRPRGRVALVMALVAALAIVLVPVTVARFSGGSTETSQAAASQGSPVPGDAPIDQVMEVAGRVGSVPVVSLSGPLTAVDSVSTDEIVVGQGRTLATGEAVLLSVATFSGTDGTNTTGTSSGNRVYRGVLDAASLGEALAEAVAGATEGSRVVLRAPITDVSGAVSTEITVVDVLPTTATGEELSPPAGTPAVTVGADGAVTVTVQGLAAPTRSASALLVRGQGQQVESDDVVIARYATVSWADGAVRNNTYGAATVPSLIDMTDTLAGITRHLVDVTVGSRVVLSLPADQATGDGAVAVVIDVLAIADDDALAQASATPEADDDGVVHVTPSAAP